MRAKFTAVPLGISTLFLSACLVGPNYQRPPAPVTPTFKEQPPAGWTQAQPSDAAIRGKWWEIYNDSILNGLEEQVAISNQSVLSYEAQYKEARDVVRIARSNLFPTVSVGPSITGSRGATNSSFGGTSGGASTTGFYSLPGDVSWTADIWGGIRRTVRADVANAQATAAQLASARLSYQSELAVDYFSLHGIDGEDKLLQETVASYQQYLQLTRDRFDAGIASDADVSEAETQLESARASMVDLEVARTQYEHAIAILVGKPPSALSVVKAILTAPPPPIPTAVPSVLLERRPDIAQFERLMAAANEQIGVATAAYYPTVSLSASGGFESTSITSWFTWPARFWSVGGTLSETVYDAGRRRGQVAQAQHAYDATVANYRQTVLTAFQQVEDNLAALRVLENEATVTNRAVAAALRFLDVSTEQYKAGTTDYLTVLTAQTAAYTNQRTAVDILTRRITSSVQLVEALGGGWNATTLPAPDQIVHGQ